MKYYRVVRTREVLATVWRGKMTEEVDILAGSAAEALERAKDMGSDFSASDYNEVEWDDKGPEVADFNGRVLGFEVTEEFDLEEDE